MTNGPSMQVTLQLQTIGMFGSQEGALAAGKDVYLEKPVTHTLEEEATRS